ncbi:MAG: ribonuclease J [SAR202 cluster bacterium]|nr:ribonuclease J [SAR202 cluster bacterium]|tara:strand:- start:37 stop:1701 length:1665 start_codon:yes stop_codon:yes gene_type:complete
MQNNSSIKVIPLGGLGEIGKNMLLIEYEEEILVIDAGFYFGASDLPGLDIGIPDISYLIENMEKISAVLITHGHEDHIGALPYILPKLGVPLYASRLTHDLIAVKLKESGSIKDCRLNVIEPYEPFTIGQFRIEFFRVSHSIPDAMGISIETPIGTIIHTGDFKIDHTPVDNRQMDFNHLSRITSNGVILLLSDSTYAEVEGYTESEKIVGQTIFEAINNAKGRVLISTFASLISRIQQVINAAVKTDRKVVIVGRSMQNNVKMAIRNGYLNVPEDTILKLNKSKSLPDEKLVIVATGSQGEPSSAMVRISNGKHPEVSIKDKDTVIFSSSPIPGNEILVAKTIDNLFRQGANVLYSKIAPVHVHGHGSKEELKLMLSLVRPKYFVPIHGEYRHLIAHANIAKSMGIETQNVFVLQDGDVLEIEPEEAFLADQVHSGTILLEGRSEISATSSLPQDRKRLANKGAISISIVVDAETLSLINHPELTNIGFMDETDFSEIYEIIAKDITNNMEINDLDWLTLGELREELEDIASEKIYELTRRRPTIKVSIHQIG